MFTSIRRRNNILKPTIYSCANIQARKEDIEIVDVPAVRNYENDHTKRSFRRSRTPSVCSYSPAKPRIHSPDFTNYRSRITPRERSFDFKRSQQFSRSRSPLKGSSINYHRRSFEKSCSRSNDYHDNNRSGNDHSESEKEETYY